MPFFNRPTTTGVEVEVGKWSDGRTIYAQKFTGQFTTSTSSRVSVTLMNSEVKQIIYAEGGYSTNSNTPDHPLGIYLSGGSGTGINFDSVATVDSSGVTTAMRFLVSSNQYNGQTGCYDLVIYYTKTS